MKQSTIMLERLRQTVTNKSGCSPLYLKVLKSDLHRLLGQYLHHEDLELSVRAADKGFDLTISLRVNEFFELGRGEE